MAQMGQRSRLRGLALAAALVGMAPWLVCCASRPAWTEADRNRISEELVRRAAEDQELRSADVAALSQEQRRAHFERVTQVDTDNTAWLKEVVAAHGWPGAGVVGDEAARSAFLLVQHADHDPEFQAACLPLLEAVASRGEIPMTHVAYLTDRVRVKQQRPQLYGTQYYAKALPDGSVAERPDGRIEYLLPVVEDLERLDDRRREAGLEPWSAYEQRMAALQQRPQASAPRPWDGSLPLDPQAQTVPPVR